jgi:hypothetical protein
MNRDRERMLLIAAIVIVALAGAPVILANLPALTGGTP